MSAHTSRAAMPDGGVILANLVDGTEALHRCVWGWSASDLTEAHIVGAERSLIALRGLLVRLRQHVPYGQQR